MQPTVLCDVHLKPMTESVTTITFRNPPWSDDFRKCREPGCLCQFNRNKGYVDLRDKQIVVHEQVWCPEHNEPKAVVAVKDGKPLRQCFHENCLRRKTLRGQICVGDTVHTVSPHHGRFRVWNIENNNFTNLQLVGNKGEGDFLIDHWENIPVDDLIPIEAKAVS